MIENQGKYNTTRKQYDKILVYKIQHKKYNTKNTTQKYNTDNIVYNIHVGHQNGTMPIIGGELGED